MNTKFNGWTNYETWRIALEIFDGYEMPEGLTTTSEAAQHLQDLAHEILLQDINPNSLASGILDGFLSDVNWYEIAENIKSENSHVN